MKLKTLPAEIYKHRGTDCSNDGLSSRWDDVLILCDDGFYDVDLDNPPENLVVLDKRQLWGEDHYRILPFKDKPDGCVGYMFGGTYVASSDARFVRMCGTSVLPLHDRCETQEQYNITSN